MARAKKTTAPARPLTEAELTVLLRERFAAPEYAFIPQVRNGTGWARRTTRTADALAMSLWPSRGLDLHGFEIKSDRADWLREKGDPEKAEEIGKFCEFWWVVAGAPNVVAQDDLFPPTWGLLVADGGKLRVVREAPRREAKPLDRAQLAAILRKASECVVPKAELDAKAERAIKAAEEFAEQRLEMRVKSQTTHLQRALDELKARVAAFEETSGLKIMDWRIGKVGEAARFIADGGLAGIRTNLQGWRERLQELSAALDKAISTPVEPTPPRTGTEG
jgi:hypothetical protein